MTEFVNISLQDCKDASRDIAEWIAPQDCKCLVAVLNAGVFPGYWVRKFLQIHHQIHVPLLTIDVQSYEGVERQGALKVIDKPDLADQGHGWLFVDEVADTGNTFAALRELYPKARFAALSYKPKGEAACDKAMLPYRQDQWLVFPWEVEDLN